MTARNSMPVVVGSSLVESTCIEITTESPMNHFFAKSVHTASQAWFVPSGTAKDFFKETNSVAPQQLTDLTMHH